MVHLEKQTLAELCLKAAKHYRKKVCFQVYRDDGVYNRLSYTDFGNKVRAFASRLMQLGVKPGDRVMILAENRPEWPVAYFGIILTGAINVPVLTDFTPQQIGTIAVHAGISALCCTERTFSKISEINLAIQVIRIDADMDHFSIPAEDQFPVINEDDPASIIYTSGTTGNSKGILLSHRNLVFVAAGALKHMKIYSRDRLISVIPLAHTYECTLGMLTVVMSGASVSYLDKPPSPAILIPAMQTLRPTAILTVPLFIEKICRMKIFPEMEKSRLYKFPLTRPLVRLLAGQKLMATFGSAIRFFGIGGAPLAEDVELFLRKIGFPYSPGYGLSETAPLVSGASPYKFPVRSCGYTLTGTEVRIGAINAGGINTGGDNTGGQKAEGEIQVKGPHVMLGYYRDEERTRAAFTEDGWFKTGDLGRLDKKGNLYILGRLKTMILGPSGENIYPEEIESIINTSLLVEDSLVIPGERGELVALIVLSEKAQTTIAALGDSIEELKNSVNKKLAAFSRLNRIEIQKEPFEKTPTMKIKRFLYPRKQPG